MRLDDISNLGKRQDEAARCQPSMRTSMGFTDKRPANYPAIDRAALMRDAHAIAKASRAHFGNYREAFG